MNFAQGSPPRDPRESMGGYGNTIGGSPPRYDAGGMFDKYEERKGGDANPAAGNVDYNPGDPEFEEQQRRYDDEMQ